MSAPTLGRNLAFGYAKEADRNQPANSPSHWFGYTEFGLEAKPEYQEDNSGFGRPEKLLAQHKDQEHIEGSMGGILDADQIGFWLYHFFGQCSSVQQGTTGAYKHTFTRSNTTEFPTFSAFYTKAPARSLRSVGTQIKSLNLDFKRKESSYKAELVALREEPISPLNPAYTQPENYLMFRHLRVRSASSVAGLTSGDNQSIQNLSINLTNETKPDFSTDSTPSVYPLDINQLGFEFEIKFSQIIRNTDLIDAYKTEELRAFEFLLENDQVDDLGSSDLKPSLRFQIPPTLITLSEKQDLNDLSLIDVAIKGAYSFADAFSIQATLQNTHTGY